MTVRTRFAPSPTGSLHIGGARTALYNYLLAKKLGGQFILRIEDTDTERNSRESLDHLLRELSWLGLHWDEGVKEKTLDSFGSHGPYQQSQRNDLYMRYANQLIESGMAYYCFADEATVDAHRELHKDAPQIHFSSPDREQSLEAAKARLQAGEQAVVRFKNTHADSAFVLQDLVRGEITFPGHMIGDFVLMRADGRPVYNFCCAIDDCEMAITHVLRGEEHLPNTLRQLMIIDALELKRPEYGHLSLILGEGNKKLSKRDGAASVSDFIEKGFIPEGLVNYLALLGWSDPESREILSLKALEHAFGTDRLHAAAPHFDMQKLRWVNHQQIQQYAPQQLAQACMPFLQRANLVPKQGEAWTSDVLPKFQLDLHTLDDICGIFAKLCDHSAVLTDSAKDVLKWPKVPKLLEDWTESLLNTLSDVDVTLTQPEAASAYLKHFDQETTTYIDLIRYLEQVVPTDPHAQKMLPATLYQLLDKITQTADESLQVQLEQYLDPDTYLGIAKLLQQTHGVKGKDLFMPLRVAILGNHEGMDLKMACQLIPIGSLIKRALYALITMRLQQAAS
ncbi:MAG: glutamate--tRNA ligase [Legionellales bacterium]|nr:glutamate--tRNA ligase [Legionellales bacterium]